MLEGSKACSGVNVSQCILATKTHKGYSRVTFDQDYYWRLFLEQCCPTIMNIKGIYNNVANEISHWTMAPSRMKGKL
jgi:hypothetical protein